MIGGGWAEAWRRVRRDWPGKLGAVVAACVLWWVATGDPGTTVQRSLLVPLQVVGAAEDEVAVGVPSRVEVVITGPSGRMDRLDADDVDVTLDLSGIDGEFGRIVDARVPQDLRVVRVVPAEVIGRLEAVRAKEVDVRLALPRPADGRIPVEVVMDPERVTVEARDPVLDEVVGVVAALATVAADATSVPLVPVDAGGVPVSEARVVPPVATVSVVWEVRPAEVTLPVAVASPADPRVVVESVSPSQLAVIGPRELIDRLAVVAVQVPDATSSLAPGSYDLPVRLALPDGVAARVQVIATVRVRPAEGAEAR